MTRRSAFIAGSLALLLSLTAGSALATGWKGGPRVVHQKFAGGALFEAAGLVTQESIAKGAGDIVLHAKGRPGRGTIVLRSYFGELAPGERCPVGTLEQNLRVVGFVETFTDLSQLYATATSGYICLDPTSGSSELVLEGVYTGGTGRFEGATGTFSAVAASQAVDLSGRVFGLKGSIDGVIELP